MNEHDMNEAYVTDYISSEQLHKMMKRPIFGAFDSYRSLDNMTVETSTAVHFDGIGPHGAVSTSNRYFKFVKSDDGWEVYEVNKDNQKVSEVFILKESVESDLEIPAPYDKYYEIASTDVSEETPEAFNHYDMKLLAVVYAKEQYEDALADNCLDCVWLVSDEVDKHLLVTAVGDRVYPLTLEAVVDCVGLKEADALDDYEESLVEDTEMSDAQRLALQELDSCLEVGELDSEKHALAYQIQWDINFEDVLLFINGIDIDLKDIKHVEYGNCNSEYDGCYNVTLQDGATKQYGWHDSDMTGSLTLIESELTEDTSEKKFQPGDHVYVTVANRGGRVIKMVSDEIVEVELEETFLYPARIDRYYVENVELIATDDLDDDEDIEGLEPVVIEHPEDIDTYLADPDNKFIPDDDF